MRQIADNAGQDGSVVVDAVRRLQQQKGDKNIGYDVMSDEYGDMVEMGIIDPAKVTRSAVENAASHRRDDPDHRGAGHRHAGEGEAGTRANAGVLTNN